VENPGKNKEEEAKEEEMWSLAIAWFDAGGRTLDLQ
jgi:hypothetical protein